MTALTANILRFERISLNDGPGMRTVVFFKGCPLRCAWCSTPESWKTQIEPYYVKTKCCGCGACVANCPTGALGFDHKRHFVVRDPKKCNLCLKCTSVCLYHAQMIYGQSMTVDEVMDEILKDNIFYFHSNGGVTLSGGDVFCYPDFTRELLLKCKTAAIHTMAELAMVTDDADLRKVIPHLNAFYVDIKTMDSAVHKKWTGLGNKRVLANTIKASKLCQPNAIHIRVPLVWGINDSRENLIATAKFCETLDNCAELEFLPYHRLGMHAYEQLGIAYPLENLPPMNRDDVFDKVGFLCQSGWLFNIRISGKTIYDTKSGIVQYEYEKD